MLLAPQLSYVEKMRALRWKAAAHITGGGIPGNLARVMPEGFAAALDRSRWDVPPVFGEIRRRGRVSDDEMWNTFNMGLGMILVMAAPDVPEGAMLVGEVVEQTGAERVAIR